ncbi:MAG: uracil-DNA glycosylase [candidate division Zixibacteria bacterium]|nr:uracil-DNA glycosylase [candidate division Zixibacteria bacterium]MCI0597055.1 uracil-DNA glycosylase [candidate division Zixibacteria bacterium]
MTTAARLDSLQEKIITCKKCPRLVHWREKVAKEKVARFKDWNYWGKPVPSFGDPNARLLVVGLAPAAHGANRTGRMFTSDRSGSLLYPTLHKFGFANQSTSFTRNDGLRLNDCYITAVVRCAPPQNKPTSRELANCHSYLLEELQLLSSLRVIVGLGKVAFDAVFRSLKELEMTTLKTKPAFGHGVVIPVSPNLYLLASYHPSQQNTFTGKLTDAMFADVFRKAKQLLEKDD